VRTGTAIALAAFGTAALVGLALGSREADVSKPKFAKGGKKPKPDDRALVGPRTDPKIAAELKRVNLRLRAIGVDTDLHDAYELLRMSKGKLAPDGSRYVAIPINEYIDNLGALFAFVVQPIEAMLGRRVIVRGAYRHPSYNAAVGGKPTSDHTRGRAADLDLVPFEDLAVAQAKFYLQNPQLPLEFGWYASGSTHVGLGGDHETYGDDERWLARARAELGIA
jgi:hypothetical protein